jgi:hypothetical protein
MASRTTARLEARTVRPGSMNQVAAAEQGRLAAPEPVAKERASPSCEILGNPQTRLPPASYV